MYKQKLIQYILKRRLLIILCVLFVSSLAVLYIPRVSFDSSLEVWFLENDPNLKKYHDFLDRFEADEITVMGVFADDVFDPKVLASIHRITDLAEDAPHVHRVRSITNIEVATGEGDTIEISPLIETLPQNAEEAIKIKNKALQYEILNPILAKDAKATAIVVELDKDGNDFLGKVEQVQRLREIADAEKDIVTVYLAGSTPIDEAFYLYSKKDAQLLMPLAALLIVIIIFFVFRRFLATLVPVVVISFTLLWIFGLMGYLGMKINVISTCVGAVVLAVGVADSIHILADYYQHLIRGLSRTEAIKKSFVNLFTPCFFTTATTAAGMLALLVSDLKPVRDFGWLAAVGVVIAFVISMSVVPVVLSLTRVPDQVFMDKFKAGRTSALLRLLGRPGFKSSTVVIILSLMILAGSFIFLTKLKVGNNALNYFKKNDPVVYADHQVENNLGGAASVEFILKGKADALKDHVVLHKIEELKHWLKELTGVTHVLSVADELKEINRVFHGGDSDYHLLPQNKEQTAQFYLIMEGEDDFDTIVQDNYSVSRISMRAKFINARELTAAIPLIENKIDNLFKNSPVKAHMTGFIKLMGDMEHYLVVSQIKSMTIALIVVIIMLGLLFRSISLALFSMIPNLLPILFGLAFMSALGIELDPGTVMIGSICLGLVVDDTVHFLVRFQKYKKAGEGIKTSISRTIQETGRPIIITSIVLALGFLILVLGSFNPNINFGLISAIVIIAALVADLVILPAALLLVEGQRSKVKGL